jgi:UDP-3-O-[3-hydroxymyristoyl] glucosamine N-acyltransferase
MKFANPYTLKDLAKFLDCEFVGKPDFTVSGINEIHVVEPGDLVFVDHPKYYDKALNSKATTILINKKVDCPSGKALIISDDPFRDFNKITAKHRPFVAANAHVAASSSIGEGTVIQPGVFVGEDCVIGKNCVIHANAVIGARTTIGDNVIIHSGTVLGGDAFYYKKRDSGFDKLLSGGDIRIENDVEIGTNCTIDRGVSGTTTIGAGTKIDNLVQIGHDTIIGKRCLFASQVGIAGCVVVEDDVTLWGQVGVISGITIGAKAVVLAQSGVGRTLQGGKTYFGSPCEDARKKYREMAAVRSLPEIIENL